MDQTNQYFPREKEIPTFPSSNNQITRSHFPRKAIPILISLSLLSLLFSFSSYFRISSYIPFLLSTFSMEVLQSYSTDRKYIFLLCNGILAFLITKSGLIAKSPLVIVLIENRIGEFRRKELELSLRKEPSAEGSIEVEEKKEEEKEEIKDNGIFFIANEEHEDEELENKFHDTVEEEEEEKEEEKEEEEEEEGGEEEEENKFDDTVEEEEEEEENKFDDTVEEEEEEENKFDDTVEEEEEEENKFDDTVEEEEEEVDEEEEEEEEGIGFLSLEELNNKCDAFIKLMREGIKI